MAAKKKPTYDIVTGEKLDPADDMQVKEIVQSPESAVQKILGDTMARISGSSRIYGEDAKLAMNAWHPEVDTPHGRILADEAYQDLYGHLSSNIPELLKAILKELMMIRMGRG